jgi:hypothetical protein
MNTPGSVVSGGRVVWAGTVVSGGAVVSAGASVSTGTVVSGEGWVAGTAGASAQAQSIMPSAKNRQISRFIAFRSFLVVMFIIPVFFAKVTRFSQKEPP